MTTIALISCSQAKLPVPAAARFLYQGQLFHHSLIYALKRKVDHIYILSAKHGLLRWDIWVEPYDESLNDMTRSQVKDWSRKVIHDLAKLHNLETDRFIILAGQRYREFITPHLTHVEIPLKGLGIGQQIQRLKLSKAKCASLGA